MKLKCSVWNSDPIFIFKSSQTNFQSMLTRFYFKKFKTLAGFSLSEFFSEEFQLVANVNRIFLYSRQASARRASRHIVKARSHPMRQTIACSWLPPARPRTTAASHSPNEFA